MSSICIIPARGGSKRIPRKNIKSFLGKPIIAYSIETALKSKLFDVVMVSTDDNEIAEIAQYYGAEVPFLRSKDNSGDFSTTFDVIEEVLMAYSKQGDRFDYMCCIYPCAPFVSEQLLTKAYKNIGTFDGIFPIIEYGHPIQRALKFTGEKISFLYKENELVRSQDLEAVYHDAGQFYFCKVSKLLVNKSIISNNTSSVVISALEAQDIDTETDWKIAELKYQLLEK